MTIPITHSAFGARFADRSAVSFLHPWLRCCRRILIAERSATLKNRQDVGQFFQIRFFLLVTCQSEWLVKVDVGWERASFNGRGEGAMHLFAAGALHQFQHSLVSKP